MASGVSSNVENVSPQMLRSVLKELKQLIADAPEGIRVLLNDDDVTDIQAIIEGPAGTPYQGGNFRIRCVLGKEFPAQPPKAYFVTKVFHPNVSRNGEICVNTLKKDWKPDLGIKHILLSIKCLLIVPNAESALNEEAGKLLLEQYDDYCRRAKMMTEIHAQPVNKMIKGDDSSNPDKAGQASSTASASSTSAGCSSTAASSTNAAGTTAGTSTATTSSASTSALAASKKPKLKISSRDKKRSLKRL